MNTQASTQTNSRGKLTPEGNVFRKTNSHSGRKVVITPENSSMQHLCYSRIILDAKTTKVTFNTGTQETALICLSGTAEVDASGKKFNLSQYDSAYIPKATNVTVTGGPADIAEFSSDVKGDYPLQIIPYSQVKADKTLHFTAGGPATTRNLNILIGKNVQAGRVMAGFTISDPGNWTSWPPHEHAKMLEEMYVYIDMPAPGFGVQFVYTDPCEPDLVSIVREGDAVLMPRGYHPNVSAPGHRIGFLWAMAAHRETEDRQFGVVNVQPEFSVAGSGLEASRK
jgi:5-deoxy-glucuronate isomerase